MHRCKGKGRDIVFLRKIVKGGADRSYGIQVAKLAGLPDSVIERAKEIAEQLLANDITDTVKNISVDNGHKHKKEHLDEVDMTQISLFDTVKDDDIIDELRSIDIGNMTPLDALNKLYQLQNKVKNRWSERIKMPNIAILNQETIDKIAAGEVVERPCSVVKELVENAIDAGSTAITVEIKEGGISFIRITDNGCGIERDQVAVAFYRHSTSKIRSARGFTYCKVTRFQR